MPNQRDACPNCGEPVGHLAQTSRPALNVAPGIGANVLGPLCYVGGWLTGLTVCVTVRQMPATDARQRLLKLHAPRSLVVFGGVSLVWILLGMSPFSRTPLAAHSFGRRLSRMYKSSQRGMYKLPIAADYAARM